MNWQLFLIPIIGFIIGYMTNWVAIIMLFHPRRKIFGMQGVIPKRKEILARKIGEITPHIMPAYIQQVEKIPLIGKRIMAAFQRGIETQIMQLSDDELEKIVYRVLRQEFFFIELIGGVLGFLIGLVQLGIVLYF